VDLVDRPVATELVFSDMRERNDKRGSQIEVKKVRAVAKATEWSAKSGKSEEKISREEGCKEKLWVSAGVAAILSSSSPGEGNLAERFFKGRSCTCVTWIVTICDGQWRQPSIFGSCFQTPPSGSSRSGFRPNLAARETDALARTRHSMSRPLPVIRLLPPRPRDFVIRACTRDARKDIYNGSLSQKEHNPRCWRALTTKWGRHVRRFTARWFQQIRQNVCQSGGDKITTKSRTQGYIFLFLASFLA